MSQDKVQSGTGFRILCWNIKRCWFSLENCKEPYCFLGYFTAITIIIYYSREAGLLKFSNSKMLTTALIKRKICRYNHLCSIIEVRKAARLIKWLNMEDTCDVKMSADPRMLPFFFIVIIITFLFFDLCPNVAPNVNYIQT